MKVVRPLFSTYKIKLKKWDLFTDEKDKLRTSSTEKNSMHKVTIEKLPEDKTIFPEDDARRLSNLLQPIRYPAKDQYDLHKKIMFTCKIHRNV